LPHITNFAAHPISRTRRHTWIELWLTRRSRRRTNAEPTAAKAILISLSPACQSDCDAEIELWPLAFYVSGTRCFMRDHCIVD